MTPTREQLEHHVIDLLAFFGEDDEVADWCAATLRAAVNALEELRVKSDCTVAALPPRHQHDCYKCTFLGRWNEYDLYHCNQSGWPTVIARYGVDADYVSGMVFGETGQIPALKEAYDRAKRCGLPLST